LSYANGGGERFDFTSDTSAIYEQGTEVVTFTYDAANTRLVGTRRTAAGAVVSNYDIDLTFNANSGNAGTATVQYSEPGGPSATDPATFTITP
jgi:hypothetical protein